MSTTKTLYLYINGTANPETCVVPAASVADIDVAAQAGGWYILPNGMRIHWALVTQYCFV